MLLLTSLFDSILLEVCKFVEGNTWCRYLGKKRRVFVVQFVIQSLKMEFNTDVLGNYIKSNFWWSV